MSKNLSGYVAVQPHSPTKLLCTFRFACNATLTLDYTGSKLHDDRLHGIRACPATWCEQLHANGTTLHHVSLLDARLHDAHEGRGKGKVVGKAQMQQNGHHIHLDHVAGQRRIGIDDMQSHVPLEQAVVDQFHLRVKQVKGIRNGKDLDRLFFYYCKNGIILALQAFHFTVFLHQATRPYGLIGCIQQRPSSSGCHSVEQEEIQITLKNSCQEYTSTYL